MKQKTPTKAAIRMEELGEVWALPQPEWAERGRVPEGLGMEPSAEESAGASVASVMPAALASTGVPGEVATRLVRRGEAVMEQVGGNCEDDGNPSRYPVLTRRPVRARVVRWQTTNSVFDENLRSVTAGLASGTQVS